MLILAAVFAFTYFFSLNYFWFGFNCRVKASTAG